MESQQATIEEKQKYLRDHILNTELDVDLFMEMMGSKKEQGSNIDLSNWSLKQIEQIVKEFKLKHLKEQRQSTNLVNQLFYKIFAIQNQKLSSTKVNYERDDLTDQSLSFTSGCRKIKQTFIFKTQPQPIIQKYWFKKTNRVVYLD